MVTYDRLNGSSNSVTSSMRRALSLNGVGFAVTRTQYPSSEIQTDGAAGTSTHPEGLTRHPVGAQTCGARRSIRGSHLTDLIKSQTHRLISSGPILPWVVQCHRRSCLRSLWLLQPFAWAESVSLWSLGQCKVH